MRLASKVAINERSTILVQFWWNFVNSSHKWGSQLVDVWSRLDKNCGIFINSQFWCQSHFLWISLYYCFAISCSGKPWQEVCCVVQEVGENGQLKKLRPNYRHELSKTKTCLISTFTLGTQQSICQFISHCTHLVKSSI